MMGDKDIKKYLKRMGILANKFLDFSTTDKLIATAVLFEALDGLAPIIDKYDDTDIDYGEEEKFRREKFNLYIKNLFKSDDSDKGE